MQSILLSLLTSRPLSQSLWTVWRNVDIPISLASSVAEESKHILVWKYLRPRFSPRRRTGFSYLVLAQLSQAHSLPPLCFNSAAFAHRFDPLSVVSVASFYS